MFNMNGETVSYDVENNKLVIIDQTRLPNEKVQLELDDINDIYSAIKELKLRGAPAIGVSMAIALSVLANKINTENTEEFIKQFNEISKRLESSRPTAVNLFWAAQEMKEVIGNNKQYGVECLKLKLREKAIQIHKDDIDVCRKIGEYGAELLKSKKAVLTHCNAGRLATVKYGTALAPVYIAKEQGHNIKVFSDETRPLLQGARLTCFELCDAGIETTLICDNMACYVMKNRLVDAVLVGCDRVALNGDTANKIGTSGVAVLAKYYNIPFYVCAPFSTIDNNTKTGADITIEMRDGDEVTQMWYKKRMAPETVDVLNPAFDVTDNDLITAFITEKGVIKPNELKKFI